MITSLAQYLYCIALIVAPPGTHHINISAASETYTWTIDGDDLSYDSTQLKPYGTPEHTLWANRIASTRYPNSADVVARVAAHNWAADHVLRFDNYHQLEKDPGGFVYAVRIGANSQKLYSITFCP